MEIKTKYEIGQKIWIVYKNKGEVCMYCEAILDIVIDANGLVYSTEHSFDEVKEEDIILEDDKDKLFEKIKQLMKEIIERYYTANEECIPKQKVKDIAKQIQEEYDKVQEQFDCIWNKKSKDNYDRYKLQELSAMQQELGFILGKFEKLLEEGE